MAYISLNHSVIILKLEIKIIIISSCFTIADHNFQNAVVILVHFFNEESGQYGWAATLQ